MTNSHKPTVNLTKQKSQEQTSIREVTPVHLLSEEDTMSVSLSQSTTEHSDDVAEPKHETVRRMGILEAEQAAARRKIGILEVEQAITDARKEISTKFKQALIFKTKRDLEVLKYPEILEKGHRIEFVPLFDGSYGLSESNLTKIETGIYTLLNDCMYNIEFELSEFDDIFEPDFELSQMCSSNAIVRFFRRKKIRTYLKNVKQEILQNR